MNYVYILTNKNHTTLYIGVTSDIRKRLDQHMRNTANAFTRKYQLYKLIYIESFEYIMDAIRREKQLKKWKRLWKEDLICLQNPHWEDLKDRI